MTDYPNADRCHLADRTASERAWTRYVAAVCCVVIAVCILAAVLAAART